MAARPVVPPETAGSALLTDGLTVAPGRLVDVETTCRLHATSAPAVIIEKVTLKEAAITRLKLTPSHMNVVVAGKDRLPIWSIGQLN